ncbi:MAG: SDR family oxidoreductase, partial [Fibrella sp.]|nr:SDR family oxidoreductase [Armatimonadota bacterium]
AVSGDLGSAAGVADVVRGVNERNVPVDILYNNAAIQNAWREIWDITQEEWQASFQTNLFAVVALCNAFAPPMKARNYGRIINLSSGIKGTPQLAPYSVSKAAIDKYTQDLAAELRGTNVLANTLDPGWLRTDMGGPNAMGDVESVLPGALVPALLADSGPSGTNYSAQEYK